MTLAESASCSELIAAIDAGSAGLVLARLHAAARKAICGPPVLPSGALPQRALTALYDAVLVHLVRATEEPWLTSAALLAIGGYGRQELAPASDLDVLVVYADDLGPDGLASIERLLRTFWDMGIDLSHRVVPIGELAGQLSDVVTASALLCGRYVAGCEHLAQSWQQQVLAQLPRERFLAAKIAETRLRHERFHNTPFVLEPQIKLCPGGLRDIEFLSLLPVVDPEVVLAPEVEAAREFLLDLRFRMHARAGRKQDALTFELQQDVAPRFGSAPAIEAVRRMMRSVYGHCETVWSQVAPRLEDGCVSPVTNGVENAPLHAVLAQATAASSLGRLPTCTDVAVLARGAQRWRQAFADSEAQLAFRHLLSSSGAVAPLLVALDRAGVLVLLVPEFASIHRLWIPAPYHRFTVDEHTLTALAELEGFAGGARPEDARREELWRSCDRFALRLALLLHDAGKGRGGEHDTVGAHMASAVCERLQLTARQGRLVRFLVEHHLLLYKASERRDLLAPQTAQAVASEVGDQSCLDALYLVTAADGLATSGQGFPRWRDALLTQLYLQVSKALAGTPHLDHVDQLSDGAVETYEQGLPSGTLRRHLALMPRRFGFEAAALRLRSHALLAAAYNRGDRPALVHRHEGVLHYVWVATRDCPGLFSKLAGVVTSVGAEVVSANAYTRSDGVATDEICLRWPELWPISQTGWQVLEPRLRDVLSGRADVADQVAKRVRRVFFDGRIATGVRRPTRITISNEVADRYSVVDVGTQDRPGLLYDLAAALSACGLDIDCVRAATRSGRAIDVFYVQINGRQLSTQAECDRVRFALERACEVVR